MMLPCLACQLLSLVSTASCCQLSVILLCLMCDDFVLGQLKCSSAASISTAAVSASTTSVRDSISIRYDSHCLCTKPAMGPLAPFRRKMLIDVPRSPRTRRHVGHVNRCHHVTASPYPLLKIASMYLSKPAVKWHDGLPLPHPCVPCYIRGRTCVPFVALSLAVSIALELPPRTVLALGNAGKKTKPKPKIPVFNCSCVQSTGHVQ